MCSATGVSLKAQGTETPPFRHPQSSREDKLGVTRFGCCGVWAYLGSLPEAPSEGHRS